MSVTEFQTKILAASVKERKVFSLLIVNVWTNYKLKTAQNKFVKKISFEKIGKQNLFNAGNIAVKS